MRFGFKAGGYGYIEDGKELARQRLSSPAARLIWVLYVEKEKRPRHFFSNCGRASGKGAGSHAYAEGNNILWLLLQ